MKKCTKVWLWVVLAYCLLVIIINFSMKRTASAAISFIELIGISLLLFKKRKLGFILMASCYFTSFVIGVISSFSSGNAVAATIIKSFAFSVIIPVITAIFLKGQWKDLK